MKRRLFVALILLMLALAGCTSTSTDADVNAQTEKIGVVTGTMAEVYATANHPRENIYGYESVGDTVAALLTNKIDTVITADITAINVSGKNPELTVYGERLTDEEIGVGIAKENVRLLEQFNETIARLKQDGTLADMERRWIKLDGSPMEPVEIQQTGETVLHVGVVADREPFAFLDADGNVAGLCAELAQRVGEQHGYKVEFSIINFPGLIPALQTGKIDAIVDAVLITEERKLQINFSDPYYMSGQIALKRKDTGASTGGSVYRAEDWRGRKIAVLAGSAFDGIILENIPGAELVFFNSVGDMVAAVRTDKADGLMMDDAELKLLIATNPDLKLLTPLVTNSEYAVMLGKGDAAMKAQLDGFIAQIVEDGTYDDMLRRWLDEAGEKPMPEIPEGNGATLTFATAPVVDGFSYIKDGTVVGFDIEFARRFAAYLDRKLTITSLDFSGVLPAVQSGKAEFAACLFIVTEERQKNVDFSVPYYVGGTAIVAKKTAEEMSSVFRAEDFEGKTFAVWTGTMIDQTVQEHIKDVKLMYFNTPPEYVEAVRTGKVDASLYDEPIIRKHVAKHPDLKILYPYLTRDEYGQVFSKQNTELRENFNRFLRGIKSDGVYDDMILRWVDTAESPPMPDFPLTGENGTLIFATTGVDEPFSYIQDGRTIGLDVELAYRFAQYMGMQLEIPLMDFGSLIPAVQSGKADFAGDLLTISEARREFVDFSDPTYIGGVVVFVRNEAAVTETASFWQSVQKSFYQNLIVENRWKMVLEGVEVTIVISVFSTLLGTLLGFLLCFMALSKLKVLNAVAKGYTMLLRGTPMVVLLMIIYYIVFAKVNIDPVYVAVIAFGLNGGAFIGEIIRSAILTVDRGQIEASRSMGFTGTGAFLLVTLPQAARVALPVYISEFISLLKGTAVVGYIAIMDLTKAGDIIRSRTYDAFFPLIAIAVVYLITIGVFIWLFNWIEKTTNKRARRDRA